MLMLYEPPYAGRMAAAHPDTPFATRPATVGSAPSPTRKSATAGRLASTVPSSLAAARTSSASSASSTASSGFSACV